MGTGEVCNGVTWTCGDARSETGDVDKSGELPSGGGVYLEFGVADSVAKHVLLEHHMTPQEYRANVLAREMAAWPQPITAQTLRTRLAAYKGRLCDVNFDLGVCASCAREKRSCKMVHTSFQHPLTMSLRRGWLGPRMSGYSTGRPGITKLMLCCISTRTWETSFRHHNTWRRLNTKLKTFGGKTWMRPSHKH